MGLRHPDQAQVFLAIDEVHRQLQIAEAPMYSMANPFSIEIGTRKDDDFCVHGNRFEWTTNPEARVIFVTLAYLDAGTIHGEGNREGNHLKFNPLTQAIIEKLKEMGATLAFSGRAEVRKKEPISWSIIAYWPGT